MRAWQRVLRRKGRGWKGDCVKRRKIRVTGRQKVQNRVKGWQGRRICRGRGREGQGGIGHETIAWGNGIELQGV